MEPIRITRMCLFNIEGIKRSHRPGEGVDVKISHPWKMYTSKYMTFSPQNSRLNYKDIEIDAPTPNSLPAP